jgi:hypothetical protein
MNWRKWGSDILTPRGYKGKDKTIVPSAFADVEGISFSYTHQKVSTSLLSMYLL